MVSRGYGENMDATMCMCSVQGNCGRGSHPEVPARVEREGDEVARAVVHWHLGLVVKVLEGHFHDARRRGRRPGQVEQGAQDGHHRQCRPPPHLGHVCPSWRDASLQKHWDLWPPPSQNKKPETFGKCSHREERGWLSGGRGEL